MNITTSSAADWTVLILTGKLDNSGAEELKTVLFPLLGGGAVALDFAGVEYVTSFGFRILMQAEKEQRLQNGQLLLGNMPASISSFFEIAGLHTLFKIVPDLNVALHG